MRRQYLHVHERLKVKRGASVMHTNMLAHEGTEHRHFAKAYNLHEMTCQRATVGRRKALLHLCRPW